VIRDDGDFARHVDYIHHNPVKHGLVANPSDWRWSSIRSMFVVEFIAPHWRGHQPDGQFGD
jgi:REP-associated tyrosine transposase